VPSTTPRRQNPSTSNTLIAQPNLQQVADNHSYGSILPTHQSPTAIEPLISRFFLDPAQRSLRPAQSAHSSVVKVSPRELESLVGLGTQFDGLDDGREEGTEIEISLGDVAALSYDEYFALKIAARARSEPLDELASKYGIV
jgi:hypothetical protein